MSIDSRSVYEFTQTSTWSLMCELIDEFIRDCRDLLESNGPYPTEGSERFGSNEEVRGALRTLRRMKNLPNEVGAIVQEANENHIDSVEIIIQNLRSEE